MQMEMLVGLSDWLFAILSIGYGTYFMRRLPDDYSLWWGCFFMFSALGSFLAGAYHIFVPEVITKPYASWLWLVTLMAMGGVSLIGFRLVVYYCLPHLSSKYLNIFGVFAYLAYVFYVSRHTEFKYASFCLGVMVLMQITLGLFLSLKTHRWQWLMYVVGWIIYIFAALVQFFQYSLDPVWLTYNTIYHLLAAVSWTMIFFAAKQLNAKA